jgi:hypothetical protein
MPVTRRVQPTSIADPGVPATPDAIGARDAERDRTRRRDDDVALLVASNKALRREVQALRLRSWRDAESALALEAELEQTRRARDNANRRSRTLADEVAALRSRSWYRLAWARFAGWPAARPGSNPTDFVRRPVLAGDGPFFQRGFLLGDAAEIAGATVRRTKRAPSGTLIFGPYVNLPAGAYAADLIKWKKDPGNPVLTQNSPGRPYFEFRDPFVFRHQGRAYMVHGGNLNQAKGGQACVSLYEAENRGLTQWKFKSILFTDPKSANIECPNFFPLDNKFVLITSPHRRCDYFVGTFDPEAGRFLEERRGIVDYTDRFYAPNTFADPKGRWIMWGWIRGFKEGRGWNGCMTLPRILSLRDGQLVQEPAPELSRLRGGYSRERNIEVRSNSPTLVKGRGDMLEIIADFRLGEATKAGLRVRRSPDGRHAIEISYDGKVLDVAGTKVPLADVRQPKLSLRLFLDKSVLEVYANDGRACVTRVVDAEEQDEGIELFASGGDAKVKSFEIWHLKTIW